MTFEILKDLWNDKTSKRIGCMFSKDDSEQYEKPYRSVNLERKLEKMRMIITEQKEKNWNCEYCNSINDWKDKKCHNCMSPRR
jgi:hypothetical protein